MKSIGPKYGSAILHALKNQYRPTKHMDPSINYRGRYQLHHLPCEAPQLPTYDVLFIYQQKVPYVTTEKILNMSKYYMHHAWCIVRHESYVTCMCMSHKIWVKLKKAGQKETLYCLSSQGCIKTKKDEIFTQKEVIIIS